MGATYTPRWLSLVDARGSRKRRLGKAKVAGSKADNLAETPARGSTHYKHKDKLDHPQNQAKLREDLPRRAPAGKSGAMHAKTNGPIRFRPFHEYEERAPRKNRKTAIIVLEAEYE